MPPTTADPLSTLPDPLPESAKEPSLMGSGHNQDLLVEIRDMLIRLMPLVEVAEVPDGLSGQGMLARLYRLMLTVEKELDGTRLQRIFIDTELLKANAILERLESQAASSEELASLRAEVESFKAMLAQMHWMVREMHQIFTASLEPLSAAG